MPPSRLPGTLLFVTDIHGEPSECGFPPDDSIDRCIFLRLADLCGRPTLSGEALHAHLVQENGLGAAIDTLCGFGGDRLYGLGFSAGGTALWRAVAKGLRLHALVCVSSTRLRYETSPLPIPTQTFWGSHDPHRPDEAWNAAVPTRSRTYPGRDHAFYREDWPDANSALRRDVAEAFASGPHGLAGTA